MHYAYLEVFMSAELIFPFDIYAKNKSGQQQICAFMNQAAHAEMDKDPHMTMVRVTPIDGRPVPMAALIHVFPLVSGFRSSYISGLRGMVQDAVSAAEAAAKKAAMRMTP